MIGGLTGWWNYGRVLTPREAWKLDAKIDDGLPGKGLALANVTGGCCNATGVTDYDATYNSDDDDTIACMLYFNHTRQAK